MRHRPTFSRHLIVFALCLAALAATIIAPQLAARSFSAPPSAIVLPAGLTARLQAGDLIFRIGDSWQSEIVRGMEHGTVDQRPAGDPYSHVGMLVGNPTHWQVLHAVPAELPGRADAVVLDDLDFFLAPERAQGAAIYRVDADASARAKAVANAMQRLGTPFRIVENDHEGQYCTTLVWYAWQHAGIPLSARFDNLNVPFAAGQYLLPHSLRIAPELHLLFEAGAGITPARI
jgi:cell wall-associated NlpC family hydrolase